MPVKLEQQIEVLFENSPANDSRRNFIKNNQIKLYGNREALSYIAYMSLVLVRKSQPSECLLDISDYELIKNRVWRLDIHGYAVSELSGRVRKKLYLHRVLCELLGKNLTDKEVDHKNGNRLDNRRANLRICTKLQNHHNSTKRKNCTSQFKGVCYSKHHKSWMVYIQKQNVRRSKAEPTEFLAALTYNHWATELFGEFAKLNQFNYEEI